MGIYSRCGEFFRSSRTPKYGLRPNGREPYGPDIEYQDGSQNAGANRPSRTRHRQRDDDGRPTVGGTVDLDLSAVRLHEALHRRKAEPGAA